MRLLLPVLLVLLVACTPEEDPGPPPPPPPPAVGPVPVILVHGQSGAPWRWAPLLERLAGGRHIVARFYAGDGPDFETGAVPRRSIWAFGYYRERWSSARHYPEHPGHASIGGCPVPREDLHTNPYTLAYVDQLDRAVEAIRRITGAPQVDLVGFSQGGLVSRAYTRWRSVKDGASRVRRLLLVASPHHGVTAVEAITLSMEKTGNRVYQKWGEIAEMNAEYPVFGGRAFVDHVNAGWDDFCAQHGIRYACVYGVGQKVLDPAQIAEVITPELIYSILPFLFKAPPEPQPYGPPPPPEPAPDPEPGPGPGPGPGPPPPGPTPDPPLYAPPPGGGPFDSPLSSLIFLGPIFPDLLDGIRKAVNDDSDGAVRVQTGRMAAPLFARAELTAEIFARHTDFALENDEFSVQHATLTEAAIRRWLIQDRPAGTPELTDVAVAVADGPEGRRGLWLSYALSGGDALAAQVAVTPAGGPTQYLGLPVFAGARRHLLPLRLPAGAVEIVIRLYGRRGELAERAFSLTLAGDAALAPVAPTLRYVGHDATHLTLAVTGLDAVELQVRVDGGPPGPWLTGTTRPLPDGLGDGEHTFELRARGTDTGDGAALEVTRSLEVTAVVQGGALIAVRP